MFTRRSNPARVPEICRREQAHTSLSDPDAGWENRLAHAGASAEEKLRQRETLCAVNQALGELSEMERGALVLFHQEECTYEQIAQVLQLPVNTVRTHLHRGRERLRSILKERRSVCSLAK